MASSINATLPDHPLLRRQTAGLRANWAAAKSEIEALQSELDDRITRDVTAVTTTATAAATVDQVFTNEGDEDGAEVTLPSAASGLEIRFVVQAAQTLTITAGSGDTIRVAALATSAAGSVTSNVVGSAITLLAINATEWVATAVVGSWSV